MSKAVIAEQRARPRSFLGSISSFLVHVFERILPDPYVFALMLTFITAAMALTLTPNTTFTSLGVAWYNGVFSILTFAFQMVLVLVTGYALASSPSIHKLLMKFAGLPFWAALVVMVVLAVAKPG